jgi:hypothetical protein
MVNTLKKKYYLLVPLTLLLVAGSLMVPVRASSVTDPQNDLVGMSQWSEEGNPRFDCNWLPTEFNISSMDIKSINWVETGGVNYSITMEFYGNVNVTYIANESIQAHIFFLVNGSVFPDDLQADPTAGELPMANLIISSQYGGSAVSGIPAPNVMEIVENNITWNFPQAILNVTAVALDSWDLIALSIYQYNDANYTNIALDHYNYDYLADTLLAFCNLVNLNIPGYSLIAVATVSIATIAVIIKNNRKK